MRLTSGGVTVYCLVCGGCRIFVPTHRYPGWERLACFRCGGDRFTRHRNMAPVFPVGFLVTIYDRQFLRELGIGSAQVPSDEHAVTERKTTPIAKCQLFSTLPMTCPLCKVQVPANTAHVCSKLQ